MDRQWIDKIFSVTSDSFDALALEAFRFQYERNSLYQAYCKALNIEVSAVKEPGLIPFLPISFFKSHPISTTSFQPQTIFESSGTTGTINSRHFVRDLSLYEESFIRGFERVYGPVSDLVIIGLLPSYLERGNSSLVYMVDKLIALSNDAASGFYLNETEKLAALLADLEAGNKKTILIGVTFALLDFAEAHPMKLRQTTIMETGGMKGRRKEMIRHEVQDVLKKAFGLETVHSEYGMTELLSQAYSIKEGIFQCPPWMEILLRDEEDPRLLTRSVQVKRPEVKSAHLNKPRSGAINIIDLANIYSCSFIATDDAARLYPNGSFEVLGRLDNSDIRGCSLLSL